MFTITQYKIDTSGKYVEDIKYIDNFAASQQVVINKARHIFNAYPHSSIESQSFTNELTEIKITSLCVSHHIVLTKTDS